MIKTQPLADMFQDKMFAWSLLQYQILIQTSDQPDGEDISNLLQLYMRGVQVMNTMLDPRQSYFRSKVTDLMGKNTVRKTFKTKQQTLIETEKKKTIASQNNGLSNKKQTKKTVKKKNEVLISANTLQQKKKELQLRLAYAAQQINPQSLKKLLNQTVQNEIKITNKVQDLMQNHQKRLNQRINRRKLKSSTYRSKQDQVQTLNAIEEEQQNKNNINIPIKNQSNHLQGTFQIIHEIPIKNNERRLHKSVQTKQKISRFEQDIIDDSNNQNMRNFQYRRQSVDFYQLIKN